MRFQVRDVRRQELSPLSKLRWDTRDPHLDGVSSRSTSLDPLFADKSGELASFALVPLKKGDFRLRRDRAKEPYDLDPGANPPWLHNLYRTDQHTARTGPRHILGELA
jgi:hypothetical protein